ncbi:hypothetical protein F2Q69_00005738 [Brassica cretica]|uniref:Uncharacterized protein n=1 Tax=Brassica cretica TaxID=69181 RepID=A0A8S9P0X7_BRACR|nr:hypothetical protein F2Q69_00005738 [Brassica cretica]
MEIVEQNDDDMMECDVQEDDLLGEEVLAMENVQPHSLAISSSTQELKKGNRPANARKRASVPLGIENKKVEFLRWGSPRVSSMSPMPKHSNKSPSRCKYYGAYFELPESAGRGEDKAQFEFSKASG